MRGATLGHYRLLEQLGAGGMGEVYLAEDTTLKRRVALKVLPAGFASNRERLERFQLEAEAVAALNHPNIVTVHSVEEASGPAGDDVRFLTMELVEGRQLDEVTPESGLPLDRFFDLAGQLLQGVAAAHAGGVIHRDLKPGNIMVTGDGRIKILDFGLAKLRASAGGPGADSELPTAMLTEIGRVLGTPAYMAPEQAEGAAVDARADVFALGAVLYEMLTGSRAFAGESAAAVQAAILRSDPQPPLELRQDLPEDLQELVLRCLRKDPAERPATAGEVAAELEALAERRAALAGAGEGGLSRRLLLPAAALVLVLAGIAGWLFLAGRRADRAREAVSEVQSLIGENRRREAAELALEVEEIVGADPILEPLWPLMTTPFRVVTDPPGAEVSYRPYELESDEWRSLGSTPYESDRFPMGAYRFRIEKEGFESIEAARSLLYARHLDELRAAGTDYLADPSYVFDLHLTPTGALPEGMVAVPGGLYSTIPIAGFPPVFPTEVPDFMIDRTEVTNAAYREFVAAGGYADPSQWPAPFRRDRESVSWEAAMAMFEDSTGRPGPATWVLGQPPESRGSYPVGGVSWFEAAAYCHWRGMSLPTLYHWARAALPSTDAWIPFNPLLAQASNFGDQGPVPAGSSAGLGVSGALDLVGNVREWVSTAAGARHYLMGGAWSDPRYLLYEKSAASPWQRLATDGFRCASYPEGEAPEHLRGSIQYPPQDFSGEPSMPDAAFETAQRFMSYDRDQPLAAAVDSSVELAWGATEEWVSIDSAYGDRLPIRLHLPRGFAPPYQVVVYFAGGNVARGTEVEEMKWNFLVRSGRAFVEPVYDGAFQRNDGRTLQRLAGAASRRELITHWIQDLGRTIDYLEQREDLDGSRVSYLGLSLGASLMPYLLPHETRFRSAILCSGGFGVRQSQAAIDHGGALARRIKIPILMLGGLEDFVVPANPHQQAMFRFFGTLEEDKHLRLYDAGHWPLPMNEVIRETADFLDRYLGTVTEAR